MTRRGLALLRQLVPFATLAVLVLSLSGDWTTAAGIPATVYGQDPLEVLELKVRPNVIVVLDSSGSMTRIADETRDVNSGDHPRSKMWQAKQVLKQIVQNNQEKVSFQLGTYTQYNISFYNQGAGANRFQYVTGTMPTTELTVRRALGDTGDRGFQAWQIIGPTWNTLYYEEDIAGTNAICAAALPGPFPKFYSTGGPSTTAGTLAAHLKAAMNAATCTPARPSGSNVYEVTYDTGTGAFTFSGTGPNMFRPLWSSSTSRPNNIRYALAAPSSPDLGWGPFPTNNSYILLYRTTGTGNSGTGLSTRWTFTETIGGVATNFYQLRAGRLWNGETIRVDSNGAVCGMDFATAATKTNPPSLTVQEADASCASTGSSATFVFGGGDFGGNNRACRGFRSKSDLVPCDLQSPPAPTQITQVLPYIEGELPFTAAGDPQDLTTNDATGAPGGTNYGKPDGIPDYVERQDGSWATQFIAVAPSAKADGWTPIANSLNDIKGAADATDACIINAAPAAGTYDPNSVAGTTGTCVERGFSKLWNQGQTGTTTMAGPAPWQLDPIKNHRDPKEKTIVLFVTDGNDTCGARGDDGSGEDDAKALRAAYYAERLYEPLAAAEPASSVQTYVIGYGGAFTSGEPTRLNWIAWGGSGLGQGNPGQPDITTSGDSWSEAISSITTKRARCTTCQDAFVAPDAATLAAKLQAIIDQGASSGDFTAQQSITESVFEYVDVVSGKDARDPSSRYTAIVPTLFVSNFSLPGFKGHLKAYQNDGTGNSMLMWSAGDKLWSQVSTAMAACDSTTVGGGAGECVMTQLHGGATDATIAGSAATIKRRIYTTTRNGVYTFDPGTLMAGTSAERVSLWPPATGILPADYSSLGPFDIAMGLPPDTPTAYPPSTSDDACSATAPTPKTYDQCWLDVLQRDHKACLGNNLPAECSSTTVNTKMRAARREARDIILAFLAGATTVPETTGIKRTSAAFQSAPTQSILYKAREWILADSELATAAVVTPPSLSEPEATPYVAEYKLFRDGTRDTNSKNVDPAGNQIRQGFGLTQPDDDQTAAKGTPDTRTAVKPVMTVVYTPANDMLHAFRAGPSCSPAFSSYSPRTLNASCAEGGGEELWGFVPYDQLEAVRLRAANEPQGRANHVYMLGRGIRFADVFVPGAMTDVNIGNVIVPEMQGVWRRILYFGRGIGGKYVTALDVTAPGPYTATALSTVPPIPLWSRGNPDTQSGVAGSIPLNGSTTDEDAYSRMGETWSMPTVVYTNPDKTNPLYETSRRKVDFAIFMGSGYGNPNAAVREGTTHYTLDALSGDVIAAVDVEDVAATYGLTRGGLSYPNAIVANSVSFNRSAFTSISARTFNVNPHPWSFVSARVYVGDLHGRLWKFLSAYPNVALPAADLGQDQPVGTAVALLGEDVDPLNRNPATMIPNIFLSAGADKRATGPFKSYSLIDTGVDTDPTTTGTEVGTGPAAGVTTFLPVRPQFARTFDQGDPEANCGYPTEAVFRGTVQPTSVVECSTELTGSKCNGELLQRVFFGGTRLSLPNTKYAPPTPLSCGTGEYPCRSQFDSILYALGVKSGEAAYDLNASTDDAYRIFRDSRIAAISFQADPETSRGGSRFVADEGLMKGTPKPPPMPGVPPTADVASANVILRREPGQPAPSVQYGSTVCR